MKKFIVTYLNENSNRAHKQFETLTGVKNFILNNGLSIGNDAFVSEFKENNNNSTDITNNLQL